MASNGTNDILFAMEAYVGTSGFSYAEWKGGFYPERLKNADMLSHYATKLRSVEINNTFYRMPRESVLQGWRDQVTEEFRFAVKANRRITHFKKLKEPGELLDYLFGSLRVMGPALGPVLFQLPPTMKADLPLLQEFLAQVPSPVESQEEDEKPAQAPVRVAIEFRHPSWYEDEVYSVLKKHGVALVSGDLDDSKKDPPLVRTADFCYLRLRRTDEYSEEELDSWTTRVAQVGVREVFAYFKHEISGPAFAQQLHLKMKTRSRAD